MLNSFDDYMDGKECGILFDEVYLKRRFKTPPTDAMLKGQRFEYLAIGTKPGGEIPGEILTNTGNISKAEETRVKTHADLFNESIKFHGIDIKMTDIKEEIEFQDYILVYIMDYFGTWRDGKPLIGDLKYSGLLYNKWEDMGWERERLRFNRKQRTQPLMYCYGYKWLHGELPDFLYHVHSSTNDIDFEIFWMMITDSHLQEFEERIYHFLEAVEFSKSYGFNPLPSRRKCKDCPVIDCQFRMKIPDITLIP